MCAVHALATSKNERVGECPSVLLLSEKEHSLRGSPQPPDASFLDFFEHTIAGTLEKPRELESEYVGRARMYWTRLIRT